MRNMLTAGDQKGFTLLELLIAVTLIAIGLMAVASMQAVSINATSVANRSAAATAFGQGVMDEILARPISDALLTANTNATYIAPAAVSSDVTVTSAGIYRATVQTQINTPTANVTRIDVTVSRIDTTLARLGLGGNVTFTAFKRVI